MEITNEGRQNRFSGVRAIVEIGELHNEYWRGSL